MQPGDDPSEQRCASDEAARLLEQLEALRTRCEHAEEQLESLRVSESKFRRLLDESTDPIFAINEDGTYEHVNLAFAKGVRRPPEEIIGHRIWDVFSQEEGDRRFGAVRATLETGQTRNIEVRVDAGGETRWYLTTVKVLADYPSARRVVICISKDITERKWAEDEVRASEERFKAVANYTYDWESWIDPHGKLVWVNSAVQRVTGYCVEECLAMQSYPSSIFEPLDEPLFHQIWQAALAGESRDGVELRIRRKDGSQRWVAISFQPILDMAGRSLGHRSSARDISERKRDEVEKAHLEEQLRHAQKMESIGRLAGGIAHDFNNLLTGIIGNTSLALMELSSSDSLWGPLKEIETAANSAAGLTRQLLSFSRKQIVDPRIVDINDLLSQMHTMLLRIIGEDVRLELHCAGDLGRVKVDPHQIEQVLVNLAVNARDAMPSGGSLVLKTSNVVLGEAECRSRPAQSPGAYVLLSVSDTGCGMSDEVRAHAFEPFFTTKSKEKGTGLGLSTAYGVVTQAGGSIELVSSSGKGTSVRIYLPRVAERLDSASRVAPMNGLPSGTETIMLVEDEPVVKEFARRLLARLGYNVMAFLRPDEAIVASRQYPQPIHLLLTDVVMPGMNGREMAEEIRAQRSDLKVLFCSGYAEEIIGQHGVLDEGIHFLGKPYSPLALARRVREVLES